MTLRTPPKTPLWLALRLPHLALEALGHHYNSATPVIISSKRQVYRFNALALAGGAKHDMPLSTAQALLTATVLEREPAQEQRVLQEIAEICYQFTPYIEFYNGNSLLLEVSRSLTLFHGIEGLTQRLSRALGKLPYHYHYGLAHTGKAAWLLSWQYHPISRDYSAAIFWERLKDISVDCLTEFPGSIAALQKSGFQTLGGLIKQMHPEHGPGSSAAIRKRFGQAFGDYLEDIFGSSEGSQGHLFQRPPATFIPDEKFRETIQFDYPVDNTEQLREPMQQLLQQLTDTLVAKQQQCHNIQWRLYDIERNRQTLTISSERIHRQWQLPLDLTMIQLEHTALSFAVDSLELVCSRTTPVAMGNHHLLTQSTSQTTNQARLSEDSERLFARLSARLGKTSLSKISYQDELLPENCQQHITINEVSHMQLPPQQLNAPRPSWLFHPPQTIQQKHQQLFWHGQLQLLQGPERLQGHWWDSPSARDYFMAQRNDYVRCWIYQDLKSKQWYVHGVF